MKSILITLMLGFSFLMVQAQKYEPTWESLDSRPIPGWFQDAKFGIFIHWGVYSVPAWRKLESAKYASYAEWYYARVMDNKENGGYDFHRKNYGDDFEYRDFAPMFKAELFDPVFWAETFNNSGAKYVVLTSKHHDGFCLWPTENPHKENWNVQDVGPHRDLLGELSNAVRAKGMKMGLYYSIPDWESIPRNLDGEYFIDNKYVEKYGLAPEVYSAEVCQPQLRELVMKYQPSLIFSDAGEWLFDEEFWKTREFLAWLYSDSPSKDDVVVNDRWCKGSPAHHGDYFSSEYKDTEAVGKSHPWEESRGVGGSYGFNRAENLNDYLTSEELIYELLDIVSRGGNLLLNVGPTADGRIPVIMQQLLADIGDWLKVNGKTIYGTRERKINKSTREGLTIYFTQREKEVFAIFTSWPNKALIIEMEVGENVEDVNLIGHTGKLNWSQNGTQLEVEVPPLTINQLPCMHAWSLSIVLK